MHYIYKISPIHWLLMIYRNFLKYASLDSEYISNEFTHSVVNNTIIKSPLKSKHVTVKFYLLN